MESKVFYLDDDNNIVDEDKCTHVIIQEYDDNGNFISEVFGYTNISLDNKIRNMRARLDRESDNSLYGNLYDKRNR